MIGDLPVQFATHGSRRAKALGMSDEFQAFETIGSSDLKRTEHIDCIVIVGEQGKDWEAEKLHDGSVRLTFRTEELADMYRACRYVGCEASDQDNDPAP